VPHAHLRRDPGPAPPPASRVTDAELIAACQGGDQAAWEKLVERYNRLVYSIPWRYGLDAAACEDAFQEVWSILVAELPRIRRATALPKWLITTTHRVSRRAAARARRTTDSDPSGLERSSLLATDEPPAERVLAWERQHLVRQALQEMGHPCGPLLAALYLASAVASYAQAAAATGMPIGSVGPTRARCLRKLLAMIEGARPEGE
jgi:RNA polymerase sigma factor (sigma-70 family)